MRLIRQPQMARYSGAAKATAMAVALVGLVAGSLAFWGPGAFHGSTALANHGAVDLSFDPSSSTVEVGETFILDIQVEAGDETLDTVNAFIDFDSTKFEVQSITEGATLPFKLRQVFDNATGQIDIVRGILGSTATGNFTLATVEILATGAGQAPFTFSTSPPRNSRIELAGVDITGTLTNGSYDLNAPPVTVDLSVTKTGEPGPVSAGTSLTYTVTVANNDLTNTASGVILTDTLPSGVAFVSATPANPDCVLSGGVLTCNLGDLAPQQNSLVTVVVDVPADFPDGGSLTNVASVTFGGDDPVPDNNNVSQTTQVVRRADLGITKSDGPDPVVAGETLTYSLTATNNGPSGASGVSITDNLPNNVSFVSADTPVGPCSESGGVVTCNVGELADGADITATIVVTLPTSATGTVSNTASVTGTENDPVASNDSATQVTTITQKADLSVTQQAVPLPDGTPVPIAGNDVSYLVEVANNGPSDATGVTFTDTLPAGVTLQVAGSDRGPCSETGGVVTCPLGDLVSGGGATIVIRVGVPSSATGTLVNRTEVTGNEADPDTENNDVTVTTDIVQEADLSLTKTDGPAFAGENITYTIIVTNNGPSDASDVTVKDDLPGETAFVSSTPGAPTCNEVAGTLTCDLGALSAGHESVVTLVGKLSPSQPDGSSITNQATASALETDPVPGNNTATQVSVVARFADLAVSKSAVPVSDVLAGDPLTYTLTVTNNGPSDASGVIVTDTLPLEVTFESFGAGQQACAAPDADGKIICDIDELPKGQDAVITIVTTVDSSAEGTITNTAVVEAEEDDPFADNNTASTKSNVALEADLAIISKTGDSATVVAGETLIYTIVVANNGPSNAADVTVTDVLPSSAIFLSSDLPCNDDNGTATCDLGAIAPTQSKTLTIVTRIVPSATPGSTITNTATVSGAVDSEPSNNTATEDTVVNREADITVAKDDSVDLVVAGETLTYTITVTNNGPSDASDVSITDTLPPGTTFVSSSPGAPDCDESGGVVTCQLGGLPAGQSKTVSIDVKVDPDLASGLVLTNQASASATEPDPNTENNSVFENTGVIRSSDLVITKAGDPAPVIAGENLTYTIEVTNNGPSEASNLVIVDELPSEATFVSLDAGAFSCNEDGGEVTCGLPALSVGETTQVTIVARVDSSVGEGETVTNRVTVEADEPDADEDSNAATTDTAVTRRVDLAVTKTGDPEPVVAGENLTYTITVTNNGPSDASDVTIIDALPANTALVSASGDTDCGGTGNEVSCEVGILAAGQSATATIVVKTGSGLADGASITNQATASAAEQDLESSNDTATAETDVIRRSDLAVTKIDGPDPVIAGTELTYTITVTNNGPSDASNVSIDDTLPPGTTFVSSNPGAPDCVESGGVVTCQLGGLPAGQSDIVTVKVDVAPDLAEETTLTNTVTVDAAEEDPVSGNNTHSEDTVVTRRVDLSLDVADSSDPAVAGDNLTYTLTVVNNGPSDASGVAIKDTLPQGTKFVSTLPADACTESGGEVSCALGALALDESTQVDVVVAIDAANTSKLFNLAEAKSTETDLKPFNNIVSEVTSLVRSTDLAIAKTAEPDPVNAGDQLTYTLAVTNNGPSAASGVTVTDKLPKGTKFVSSTPGQPTCGVSGRNVTCELGDMAKGANALVTITVETSSSLKGTEELTNSANVRGKQADPVKSNNEAELTSTVQAQVDLSVTNTVNADQAPAGGNLLYSVEVTNNGPSDAHQVVLTDVIPAGTTFISSSPARFDCAETGTTGEFACSLGTIKSNASKSLRISIGILSSVTDNTVLTNTASAVAEEGDTDPDNDSATATTTVVVRPDLSLTKADDPDGVFAGENLTYKLTATNLGPSDASGVILTDTLDAGTTFVSSTPGAPTCTEAQVGVVACDLGDLAAKGAATVTIVVKVDDLASPGKNVISNSATIGFSGDGLDPDSSNNTAIEFSHVYVDDDEDGVGTDVENGAPNDGDGNGDGEKDFDQKNVTSLPTLSDKDDLAEDNDYVTIAAPKGTVLAGVSVEENPSPADTPDGQVFAVGFVLYGLQNAPPPVTVDIFLPEGSTPNTYWKYGPTPDNAAPHWYEFLFKPVAEGGDGQTGAEFFLEESPPRIRLHFVDGLRGDDDLITDNNIIVDPGAPAAQAADLGVTKADNPDSVNAGDQLTYTLVVTNLGPQNDPAVTLTDTLPAGVTYVSATPTQGTCSEASGTVTCNLGAINDGDSATATVVVNVDPGTRGLITNAAAVQGSEPDDDPINNSVTEDTTVVGAADLVLAKTGAPNPVTAGDGDGMSYAITLTNNGPSDATNVVVTETLPAGASAGAIATSQGTCSEDNNVVTCDIGGLADEATVTITIPAIIGSGVTGEITSKGSATADETDAFPINNTDVETKTTVNAVTDLSVVLTDDPDPVRQGDGLEYEVVVANTGPSDATTVTMVAELPPQVTSTSANTSVGTCSNAAGTVTCNIGDLASGGTATVSIQVTVSQAFDLSVTPTITATASVSGNETDSNDANDSATSVTQVIIGETDLEVVSLSDAPDPVVAGEKITYTAVVNNKGPVGATNVTLTDNLPGSVTYFSGSATQGSCAQANGLVTCTIGDLGVNQTATVTIVVTVDLTAQAGNISNTVVVTSAELDEAQGDNSATATTGVTAVAADLSVTKTVSNASVAPGATLTFTVTATNHGPDGATNVAVTDNLPSSVTFVTASQSQGTCAQSGGTVTCDLGSLGVDSSATVAIDVTVNSNVLGTITNTASVSAAQTDPEPSGNTATGTTDVVDPESHAITFADAITGSDTNECNTVGNPCATIGGAISQTSSGGTVNVAAGTYAETVNINRALTLQGVGDTSIIQAASGNSVEVRASNTTVDNLKIVGPSTGSAIKFLGNVVHNNITISNNTFDCAGTDCVATCGTTSVCPSTASLAVTGNTFSGWGTRALSIGEEVTSSTVSLNNFLKTGPAVVALTNFADSSTVTAINNFWGKASGPSGIGAGDGGEIVEDPGSVTYRPWLLVSDGATFDETIVLTTDPGDWTLFSAPRLLSAVPTVQDDNAGIVSMLAYTGGAFVSPGAPFNADVIKPVGAFFVKATNNAGIGFKYANPASPGLTSKELTPGWNLVGTNNSALAKDEFSSIQSTQFASGLITLYVPDTFNDSARKDKGHIDWTDDGDRDLNANPITTLPSKNLSTLDGYWVFVNTTQTFSKQLIE